MMLNNSIVLGAAARCLEQNGWTQGAMHDERGYCALGALLAVNAGVYHPACEELAEFLVEAGVSSPLTGKLLISRERRTRSRITWWNDSPRRRKEEVVRILRDLADRERIKEYMTVEVRQIPQLEVKELEHA